MNKVLERMLPFEIDDSAFRLLQYHQQFRTNSTAEYFATSNTF